MKKKKTSRQLQAEETRKKLIDAGMDIMQRKRLNDVSIQEITDAVGVSTGTFYLYFPSKEAFFTTLFHENSGTLLRFFEDPVEETLHPIERLSDFILGFMAQLKAMDINFVQQWFAHFGDADFYGAYGHPANPGALHFDGIRECLEKAVEIGELDSEAPIKDIAALVSLLLSGLAAQVAMSSFGFDYDRRAELIYDHCMNKIVGPYRIEQ